jgi:hypothetical protein
MENSFFISASNEASSRACADIWHFVRQASYSVLYFLEKVITFCYYPGMGCQGQQGLLAQ